MKNITRIVVSFVYYNSLVRDTLEYSLPRENYDVKFYDYKRNGIVNEPKINSPLHSFIERNGEKGEQLNQRLTDFAQAFYSDDSTVVKKAADGTLRVDHAQAVKVIDMTVPLHEELNSVVKLHRNYAHEHAQELNADANDLKSIDDLVLADERFYRAVAFLSLSNEIFKQFDEYNKARREANGEKTPQSNFIEQDLNTLYKNFEIVRRNATCNDSIYTDALDAFSHAIEMTTGRRQIPTGKNFGDVINEVNAKVQEFVKDSETKWREVYQPLLNELVQEARAQQQAQQQKEESK